MRLVWGKKKDRRLTERGEICLKCFWIECCNVRVRVCVCVCVCARLCVCMAIPMPLPIHPSPPPPPPNTSTSAAFIRPLFFLRFPFKPQRRKQGRYDPVLFPPKKTDGATERERERETEVGEAEGGASPWHGPPSFGLLAIWSPLETKRAVIHIFEHRLRALRFVVVNDVKSRRTATKTSIDFVQLPLHAFKITHSIVPSWVFISISCSQAIVKIFVIVYFPCCSVIPPRNLRDLLHLLNDPFPECTWSSFCIKSGLKCLTLLWPLGSNWPHSMCGSCL